MTPEPPPLVATPPRYCRTCGTPLAAPGEPCRPCAAPVTNHASAAAEPSLALVFALYFALLASPLAGMPFATDEADGLITGSAALVVVACFFVIAARRELRPALVMPRPSWALALAPLVGLGTFGIAAAAVRVLEPLGVPEVRLIEDLATAGIPTDTIVVAMVVAPAVFEELAIRGVMLARLLAWMGPGSALVVTSCAFSLLHLSAASFVHLFLAGLAFGGLRLWSNSVWPAIVAHAAHNSLWAYVELRGA